MPQTVASRRTPYALGLPIKGVDKSQPDGRQPDFTCPEALNMRSTRPGTDRVEIAKRAGTSKAFTARAGAASTRRIKHLIAVPRTVVEAAPAKGMVQSVNDIGFQKHRSTYDMGGEYVLINKKSSNTYSIGEVAQLAYVDGTAGQQRMTLTGANSTALGATLLAINYETTNEVSCTIGAHPVIDLTTNNFCTDIGPFVRGSAGCADFVVAYLYYVGTKRAGLRVERHQNGVVTVLAISQNEFALSGFLGTFYSDLVISLQATADTITARATWPSVSEIALECSITGDTTMASNTRGGVWHGSNDNGVASARTRILYGMQYKRRIPPTYATVSQLLGSDFFAGAGATNYLVPTTFQSYKVVAAAGGSSTADLALPYNDAAQPNSADSPAIKNDANFIYGPSVAGADHAKADLATAGNSVTALMIDTGSEPTERYGIDIRFNSSTTANDQIHPCFRINPVTGGTARFVNFYKIVVERVASTTAIIANGAAYISQIRVYRVANGQATLLSTTQYGSTGVNYVDDCPTFSLQQWLRFTDDGSTFRMFINGVEAWSYAVGTTDNTFMRPGVDINSVTGSGTFSAAQGFRFVRANALSTVTPVSEGTDVLAFTDNLIETGLIGTPGTLTDLTGLTFTGTNDIDSCIIDGKVYAVDGSRTLQVDPIAQEAKVLVAEDGSTIPDGATVCCNYRGGLVLANRAQNRAQVAISRRGKPGDFNYGSSAAQSTRATLVSFAEGRGQPPETIIDLAPFKDDYLFLLGSTSTWVIEGDPAAGGVAVAASTKTGLLAKDAWCFIADGTLLMLSTAGLAVVQRGGIEGWSLTPILSNRLSEAFERFNPTNTKVAMVYRALTKTVHIFLTPRDGTSGQHVTLTGCERLASIVEAGIWPDEYPVAMQPWSACEITGNDPALRGFLFGADDGYIYQPDDTAESDSGHEIETRLRFAPMEIAQGWVVAKITELAATLGRDSNATVNWHVLVADSAQDVNDLDETDAVVSGTFTGDGRQPPVGMAYGDGAIQVLLTESSDDKVWSVTDMAAVIEPMGRRR